MIKIGICDDDKNFCEQVKHKTEEVMAEEFPEILYQVEIAHNQDTLMKIYETEKLDVLFLDIEVGAENGFEIANEVGRRYSDTKIIFITSHDNLVYDSFEYRPFGFVRKRLFDKEYVESIQRVLRTMVEENSILIFGEIKAKRMFTVAEIYAVEAMKHNILISLQNEQIEIRDKISNHAEELIKDGFVQINKGVYISLRYVKTLDQKLVVMQNEKCYAISRNHLQNLKEKNELYQMKKRRQAVLRKSGENI